VDTNHRDVVVWRDPLDAAADKLVSEFPYGNEPFGLRSTIKLILWVLMKTNVLKVK
jgi:hypothetical protein